MAYGLSPEGGSSLARHQTRPTESPLAAALRVRRGVGSSRWGFFLRAETMHGATSSIERSAPDDRETGRHAERRRCLRW
jgi:predicted ATPase